jgi:hypothetical protein
MSLLNVLLIRRASSSSFTRQTPADRLIGVFTVSDSVVMETALTQGHIAVIRFSSNFGLAAVYGSNITCFLRAPDFIGACAANSLISLGNLSGDLEIVGTATTAVTVTALYLNSSCSRVEWISSGSVRVSEISTSHRLCFISASLTGTVTVTGTLGGATIAVIGPETAENLTGIPESGLKYNLNDTQLIQVYSGVQATADLRLDYQSNTTRRLTVADETPRGIYDDNWTDFEILHSEPTYPPVATDDDETDASGIIVMAVALVLVLNLSATGIIVRLFVADDGGWLDKARNNELNEISGNQLTPNMGEIPGDFDYEKPRPTPEAADSESHHIEPELTVNPYAQHDLQMTETPI